MVSGRSILEVNLYSFQFIGTLAAGRWSELRGDRYSEARNVLVQWKRHSLMNSH